MKIGIDLGGSHIAIGIVDDNGNIIEKIEKRIMSKEKKNIKKSIEAFIIENINILKQKYEITQIGMAIPGTVTKEAIIKSVNLGLENYNIATNLKEKLNQSL